MPKQIQGTNHDLYDALVAAGLRRREAVQLQNAFDLTALKYWHIDPSDEATFEADTLVVLTHPTEQAPHIADRLARNKPSTLCVRIARRADKNPRARQLIAAHTSTSVETPSLLMLFNNTALPKQHIVL